MYFSEDKIKIMKAEGLFLNADLTILSQIKEPYLSFIIAVLYGPCDEQSERLKINRKKAFIKNKLKKLKLS